MGYTTYFSGEFVFNKTVDRFLANYIQQFIMTRHVKWNNEKLKKAIPNWKDYSYKGFLGNNGEFLVNPCESDVEFWMQYSKAVEDCNQSPDDIPGLWCQWKLARDNKVLRWDGGEKFYNYIEWLEYLITKFFAPNGYVLNGTVKFAGEESVDNGIIIVTDNKVNQVYDTFSLGYELFNTVH